MTTFEEQVNERVHDPRRVAAAVATGLLDTGPEATFDEMGALVAELLGVPMAFVTVVDERRSYWKACIGIGGPDPADRQNPVGESFCQYVIGLGTPLLVDDARLDPRTKDNLTVTDKGLVAWAGHPIIDHEGNILGTFCAVDVVPRRWTERDARVLKVFADAVSSELDLRSTAQRAEALSNAARRLADLAGAMSAATSTAEVGEMIVEQGAGVVGAEFLNLGLVDEERRLISVSLPRSLDPTQAMRFAQLPFDSATPMADAIRTGEPVYVADDHDRLARYPDLVEVTRGAGLVSTFSVPLRRRSDGSVIGALGFGWGERREPSSSGRGILDTLVSLCQETLERTSLTDTSTELVTQLQTSLLPKQTPIEHLDIAVRYLAANDNLGLGGDWYDIVQLDEHRTQVVIGDVVGHGVEATARMSQLQGILNALIRIGTPLEQMFVLAEQALASLGEGYIATIDTCVVDVGIGQLRHVSAGHPPPVVWTPADGARRIDGGRRRLIGSPVGAAPVPDVVDFPPGSVLVSYTDGLVERPGETFDDGIDRVIAYLDAQHSLTADEIADGLLDERYGPAGQQQARRDDTALAVVVNAWAPETA